MNDLSSSYVNLIAGCTQATLVTITGYPFDLVKVKMQAYGENSTLSTMRTILKKEGMMGFYKGSTMPWISHLVKRPIQYPIIEWLKTRSEFTQMGKSSNFFIGALSGLIGPVFGTPLQVMKIRAQLGEKTTITNLARQIYRESGWTGFYRGIGPTIFKDSLFGASFIGFYYTFRDMFGTGIYYMRSENSNITIPIPRDFISGATAHCLTWGILIPIDFVKTRVQKSDVPITALEVIRKNYSSGGFRIFWHGILPACLRTIPVSGIAMTGYEYVRKQLLSPA